ncbi:hypothetical protein SFRURICE_012073, partial [Spodoptera frugiperda]
MSDIKSLIKKRASIKAKLTQFSSKLSEVQIVEVEYRLNIFENLYDKYDMLQTDIEETVDDPSEQYAEREEFEKQYYTLVAAARQLISSCSISFNSINSEYEIDIDCYVMPKISSSVPNTYIDAHNISIPTNIVLADPQFYVPSSIDILVGAEVFWNVIGTNRIELGKSMPTLFESKLGWLLSGVITQRNSSSHLCLLADNLQADLDRFWKLDSISSKHTLTREERSCFV